MALTQISTGGVKDDAVTAGKIPADAVGQSEIADEAVDEARLQISNAGTNGQFLSKQSGNTGGLTWATATTDTSDKASLSGCNFTGSVGVNTSSPVRKLHVTADNVPAARFERDTSDGAIIEIRDTSNNTIASIGSESGDLEISAENSNNLRFAVGTSEKFRVGSSGQLGVGGATYGSSGQVLTSGGASAAPSWAAIPPAGNTIDLVADGAIAAGKPVVIKTNGKAAQVAETYAAVTSGWTPAQEDNTNSAFGSNQNLHAVQSIWDPEHKRLLTLVTKQSGTSGYLHAFHTSSSTGAITFAASASGEMTNFAGGNRDGQRNGLAWSTTDDMLLIAHKYGNYIKYRVYEFGDQTSGTISMWNYSGEILSGNAYAIRAIYDATRNKFVVTYQKDSELKQYVVVGTLNPSNRQITWGSEIEISTTTNGRRAGLISMGGGKFCLSFSHYDNNNSSPTYNKNFVYAVVGDISSSSNTATMGSVQEITNVSGGEEGSGPSIEYDVSRSKLFFVYGPAGNNTDVKCKSATCSGTTLTISSEATITTDNCHNIWEPKYDSASYGMYCITVQSETGSNAKLAHIDLSGTNPSVTAAAATFGMSNDIDCMRDWTYNPHNKQLVGVAANTGSNMTVFRIATTTTTTNATAKNIIGWANSAISDTATGTINLQGSVATGQSSLTPGEVYFVQPDGTLGSSVDGTQANLLAIASDKGLVQTRTAWT